MLTIPCTMKDVPWTSRPQIETGANTASQPDWPWSQALIGFIMNLEHIFMHLVNQVSEYRKFEVGSEVQYYLGIFYTERFEEKS